MRIMVGFSLLIISWLPLAAIAGAPFDSLRKLSQQQVAVTALAVDLSTGKVIDAVDADQRLVPASLSKLFTAAVALDHWGSDHHFSTKLYADGKPHADKLEGDLILFGGGDGGLVSETLWTLIGQLQSQGITRVTGDLVVNASRFGALDCQSADRCSAQRVSANAYNAGLSSAGINYGTWCVRVTPAEKAGDLAKATTCPFALPVAIDNQVKTVAKAGSVLLRRVTDKKQQGEDKLRVSGTVGTNQSAVTKYVSAGDSNYFSGVQLKQQLALAGITVAGQVRVSYQSLPASAKLLASMDSEPLDVQVKRMLEYSNNYMADVLALNLLAETSADNLSLAAAGDQVLAAAEKLTAPTGFRDGAVKARLASGSGLSLESRLSARDLVTLLDSVYARSDIFPAFVGGLTVPKFSVLGILRGPEAVWKQRVMVKSGSLNQPHTVYGIAGYLRPDNQRWIAFAVLLNGTDKRPQLPYADSLTQLRQAVVALDN